jgi:hypothetical protein
MICSRAASDLGKMDLTDTVLYASKFVTTVPMTVPRNIVKLAGVAAGFCVYFAAAYWLQATFTPDRNFVFGPDVPGEKLRLMPPFKRLNESTFAVVVEKHKLFDELADSDGNNTRSTIELYENDTRLGPAHSSASDIANLGYGRFSHWRERRTLVLWSSSDNTDPATNGRAYWLVKPAPEMHPPEVPATARTLR